jgi:hypothetical protein
MTTSPSAAASPHPPVTPPPHTPAMDSNSRGHDQTPRRPSTTPAVLRRLRAVLITLTLLTAGAALLVFAAAYASITSAGQHTARAVLQAAAARQALADADSQAVQTIPLGAGPAGQYQDDVAAAEQSLEQVAENNAAGAAGSHSLQLTEGSLTAYTGLIEQADAHYRMPAAGQTGVGFEYLWSASNLLHSQILTGPDGLSNLLAAQQRALAGQRSSPWVSPWLSALWVVPAIALLAMLVATQLVVYRRFRRLLKWYLTLAVAALLALSATTWHVIGSEHRLEAAISGPFTTVSALRSFQQASIDWKGQQTLQMLALPLCGQCAPWQRASAVAMSDTRQREDAQAALARANCAPDRPECITSEQGVYDRDVAAAQAGFVSRLTLIATLAALMLLLIPLALRRHLDEYRWRSR